MKLKLKLINNCLAQCGHVADISDNYTNSYTPLNIYGERASCTMDFLEIMVFVQHCFDVVAKQANLLLNIQKSS